MIRMIQASSWSCSWQCAWTKQKTHPTFEWSRSCWWQRLWPKSVIRMNDNLRKKRKTTYQSQLQWQQPQARWQLTMTNVITTITRRTKSRTATKVAAESYTTKYIVKWEIKKWIKRKHIEQIQTRLTPEEIKRRVARKEPPIRKGWRRCKEEKRRWPRDASFQSVWVCVTPLAALRALMGALGWTAATAVGTCQLRGFCNVCKHALQHITLNVFLDDNGTATPIQAHKQPRFTYDTQRLLHCLHLQQTFAANTSYASCVASTWPWNEVGDSASVGTWQNLLALEIHSESRRARLDYSKLLSQTKPWNGFYRSFWLFEICFMAHKVLVSSNPL